MRILIFFLVNHTSSIVIARYPCWFIMVIEEINNSSRKAIYFLCYALIYELCGTLEIIIYCMTHTHLYHHMNAVNAFYYKAFLQTRRNKEVKQTMSTE